MKKIIVASILLISSLTILSGCNKQVFDFNYEFDKVHLHEADKCVKIKKWNDYEGEQIQVILEDGTVMLVSSNNADLINGKCPYCEE